ncbi:hypothetical protein AGMMS50225_19570 [Betaproteobacteria bacterium]|nr:hypothetical protein AGMMS50225_19570 [Betaproteobacteria bacterium]
MSHAPSNKQSPKEEPLEKQLWKAADKLHQNLAPTSLGGLIGLVSNIALGSADVLGHVFEYFLGEGKQGGQSYTPRSIVESLVTMLAPTKVASSTPAWIFIANSVKIHTQKNFRETLLPKLMNGEIRISP